MTLKINYSEVALYISSQLNTLFPLNTSNVNFELNCLMPKAIERFIKIKEKVKFFSEREFNLLNSLQYSTLIYILSNEEYIKNGHTTLAEKLFYLNKTLNSIDLFYSVEMPSIFFISHGIGSVLGNVKYGENLVIFQNVTVGRVGDKIPILGNDVILYPGVVVTGNSVIGNNCVIGANTVINNKVIPDNTLVFNYGNNLVMKTIDNCYKLLYFNNSTY